MPVAKPKKRAKSKPAQPDTMTPNMQRLATYLMENGLVKDVITGHEEGVPGFSTGLYRPKSGTIGVISGDEMAGSAAFAHEVVHALKGKESRVSKMSKEYSSLSPFVRKDIIFPKHWTEGMVGDVYSSQLAPGRIRDLVDKSDRRRLGEVRKSIQGGEEWSGIPGGDKPFFHSNSYEEGSAYYMSEPLVASPMKERAKEFGMYLLNHNVPMDIVEGVVKDLSKVARPERRYSGGSYEMHQLLDKTKKNEFNPDGNGYDYQTARDAGLGPDATGHWPSREPRTGQILKGRKHPTFNLTEEGEAKAGMEIYQGKDGKYYSRPK